MTTPLNTCTFLAVINLACRFRGAPNMRAFWDNLAGGADSMTRFPTGTAPDGFTYRASSGVVGSADESDATFFDYLLKALITGPPQRVFLECAWKALEDADCDRWPTRTQSALMPTPALPPIRSHYVTWRPSHGIRPWPSDEVGVYGTDNGRLARLVEQRRDAAVEGNINVRG